MVRRLVEQQQVGPGGEGAGERGAGQLAAGEGRDPPLDVLLAEAEAAQDGEDVVAPAVAAAVLEPVLGIGVGGHRLLVGGPLRHRVLEAGELGLGLQHVRAPREDVVAERRVRFARRALVVQGDAGVALDDEAARVGAEFARQNPQQGRLAGAVAPGEGHPARAARA